MGDIPIIVCLCAEGPGVVDDDCTIVALIADAGGAGSAGAAGALGVPASGDIIPSMVFAGALRGGSAAAAGRLGALRAALRSTPQTPQKRSDAPNGEPQLGHRFATVMPSAG